MKHITLWQARDRAGLTQQELEERSGVDRTRISRLELNPGAKVMQDTYDQLVAALVKAGGLRPGQKLVMGGSEKAVA